METGIPRAVVTSLVINIYPCLLFHRRDAPLLLPATASGPGVCVSHLQNTHRPLPYFVGWAVGRASLSGLNSLSLIVAIPVPQRSERSDGEAPPSTREARRVGSSLVPEGCDSLFDLRQDQRQYVAIIDWPGSVTTRCCGRRRWMEMIPCIVRVRMAIPPTLPCVV
jgi:hypothetical protein